MKIGRTYRTSEAIECRPREKPERVDARYLCTTSISHRGPTASGPQRQPSLRCRLRGVGELVGDGQSMGLAWLRRIGSKWSRCCRLRHERRQTRRAAGAPGGGRGARQTRKAPCRAASARHGSVYCARPLYVPSGWGMPIGQGVDSRATENPRGRALAPNPTTRETSRVQRRRDPRQQILALAGAQHSPHR